jgi:hypothetical protein
MAYIPDEIGLDIDQVMQWENSRAERINTYKTMYTQETAQKLIDMATQYHWVNPQITAALVLNGADYLMQDVANHAAEKMADAGLSPADRWRAAKLMDSLRTKAEAEGR